ncbi:MAG: LysM peptidoglycan-binding domain-containing protein [Acidimicrobiales bacterium]|nr:LysM peptidoglycan-binding domain-containing protein [Acidimicrobiales bacterium]
MTRARTLAKGAAALAVIAVLAGGIPWALTRFVGWPLPHRLPTWTQFSSAVSQHGIPDDTLIKALASVVWIAWAVLAASLAVELHAVVRGGTARRLPIAGPLQAAVGNLLAAVVIAALSISVRTNPAPQRPLAAAIPALRPPVPAVALAVADSSPMGFAATVQSAATSDPDATSRTYVVQRNDTLWGIAERQLGDPLRWRDIYNLNHGRPQPGGTTLTDPHWINQGWALILPAPRTSTPNPTPLPATPPAAATSVLAPAERAPVPATVSPSTAAPTSSPRTAPDNPFDPATTPAHSPSAGPDSPSEPALHRHSTDSVTLPSGSVVAASFATGVLSAITVGRLRRRHGYQPQPPQPGRSLATPPLGPTLRRLSAALGGPDGEPDDPTGDPSPPSDEGRRVDPDLVEIGELDGTSITAGLTSLSGTALCGKAADQIARAWIAALLTRAGPLAAQVVATAETIGRLFGSGPEPSGITTTPDTAQLIRNLEAEVVGRTRLFECNDTRDAGSFRQANPAEPLPGLLFVLDAPTAEDAPRLKHTIGLAPRLGIAVIFLGATNAAVTRLQLQDRTVAAVDPPGMSARLEGARLFGLTSAEAADILRALTDAEFRPTSEANPEWTETIERIEHPPSSADPWPIDATHSDDPELKRPIRVQALGPLTITVMGNTITRGLRSVAKELLVYYVLRPEGATVEEAVDHLWPDTDPKLVHRQFWTAASNLRSRLREWGELESKILDQVGNVYRLDPNTVFADLWDFQTALDHANRAGDDNETLTALRRAVAAYRGDLAQTAGWLWLGAPREDLHRRAVNAHLRLAELEQAAGNPAAAEATLEKVIDLDRYAEEPYRRLMTLQAGQGRTDAVKATWRQLQRRLVEIDLDPDPATGRLYRQLVADEPAA